MTQVDIYNIIELMGGIGLFLFATKLIADGLQRATGEKMKSLLGTLADNRIKGILVGIFLTALIQSSGDTSVMVVGYVNSGILNLTQAIAVIMGANIGTTVTSWVVALYGFGPEFGIFGIMFYVMIFLAIGSGIYLYTGPRNRKGEILLGFGLLFVGLGFIKSSIEFYANFDILLSFIDLIGQHPLLGILLGIVLTMVLQSSAATIAILQVSAIVFTVPMEMAVYICMGAGVGACFKAIFTSRSTVKDAQRAAIVNLLMNVFGTMFWGMLFYILLQIFIEYSGAQVGCVFIAIFYTGYKILNVLLFAPIYSSLVSFSNWIIKGQTQEDFIPCEVEETRVSLDFRILNTPSLAIQAVSNYILKVAENCNKNIIYGMDALLAQDLSNIPLIYKKEQGIDRDVAELTEFLAKLSSGALTERQSTYVKDFMYTVIDLERIGDHAENLAELAELMQNKNFVFSNQAISDLQEICEAVKGSVKNAIEARASGDLEYIRNTFRFEDDVDSLEEEIRDRHIKRLALQECNAEAGVVFLDILTNLERVSDHAVNIAGYVKDEA